MSETIAALATPPGTGAICIIRLSGPDALTIAQKIVSIDLDKLPSHTARLARLLDDGEVIDEALVIPFHGASSFTGEPVVEIQGHGGPLIAQRILRALTHAGARLAEPGEFSLRAYQNGKIDLSQAEAIQGMIHAKSERARRIHMAGLQGSLSNVVGRLRAEMVRIGAVLEAWVDFPEEGLEFCTFEALELEITALIDEVARYERSYAVGSKLAEGMRASLIGAPNTGKSSLLNRLLGKERSIVTAIAGTTRDYIEEEIALDGLTIRLTDTAGLRRSDDAIEEVGIERTFERMAEADLILALFDASQGIDQEIAARLPLDKTLVVWNKIDIAKVESPKIGAAFGEIEISALKSIGIEELKKRLVDIAAGSDFGESDLIITNERHAAALGLAKSALIQALEGLKKRRSAEFVALDMRSAIEAISQITGGSVTEDLLDALFGQFCLGK